MRQRVYLIAQSTGMPATTKCKNQLIDQLTATISQTSMKKKKKKKVYIDKRGPRSILKGFK
jgi:hypothetical protein